MFLKFSMNLYLEKKEEVKVMKDSIRKSLINLQEKADELSKQLADPSITSDISKLTSLNKEFSEIKDVVENWLEYQKIETTILDLEKLLKDEEMKDMAQEEKTDCESRLEKLESEIMVQLLPKDKDDARNSFLELRAGAGGDEAAHRQQRRTQAGGVPAAGPRALGWRCCCLPRRQRQHHTRRGAPPHAVHGHWRHPKRGVCCHHEAEARPAPPARRRAAPGAC